MTDHRREQFGPVTLYLGDCREIVPKLTAVDALISDPPYGAGYKVNSRPVRGGILTALKGLKETSTEAQPMIIGDDEPFDPRPWLMVPKVALFGATYFCDRLPRGTKWISWDKREGGKADDHSDCDFIWTSVTGASRIHRQLWRGVCRRGEENCSRSKKLHTNQKPVALIDRIFDELRLRPGQTVSDPYMGAGSTGVVAIRRGLRFVGCEIDPGHFDTALQRLRAEVAIAEPMEAAE